MKDLFKAPADRFVEKLGRDAPASDNTFPSLHGVNHKDWVKCVEDYLRKPGTYGSWVLTGCIDFYEWRQLFADYNMSISRAPEFLHNYYEWGDDHNLEDEEIKEFHEILRYIVSCLKPKDHLNKKLSDYS